jgi:hypothetical protein
MIFIHFLLKIKINSIRSDHSVGRSEDLILYIYLGTNGRNEVGRQLLLGERSPPEQITQHNILEQGGTDPVL